MKKFISERLYKDIANISLISNKIQETRKISTEIESEFAINHSFEIDSEESLFSDVDLFEIEDNYNYSEEYLQSDEEEIQVFSACVGAFDISNPRTLVRIHNTITLLKGLYPDISESSKLLEKYIFLTFLHEIYSSTDSKLQEQFDFIFNGKKITNIKIYTIKKYANEIKINEFNKSEIRNMYNRVKRYSLPCISQLLNNE
jgi:hypothetical protein